MAKATLWTVTDAEARKRGEQTGLDTRRATHVLQWLVQRDAIPRGGAKLKNQSQFGL